MNKNKMSFSLALLLVYSLSFQLAAYSNSCQNKKLAKKYKVTYNEVDYGLFTFTMKIVGKVGQNRYRTLLTDRSNGITYDGELINDCGSIYFSLPLIVGVDFYTTNEFGIDQYVGSENQRADVDCSGNLNRSSGFLGNCSAQLFEPNTGDPYNYSGYLEARPLK